MFEIRDLKKSYGSSEILRGVNLSVASGEIATLLGPNGAGKTTTIRCILGLLTDWSGEIKLLAKSIPQQKSIVGCIPQESEFPPNVTGEEVLRFVAGHFVDPLNVNEAIERFQIKSFVGKKTRTLSGGQRRCLGLACALIGRPKFVVLDEPTVGLDVEVRKTLWREVKNFVDQGGGVLLTTHYLEEAEQVADKVYVINRGKVIRQGRVEEIKKELGFNRIQFYSDKEPRLSVPSKYFKDRKFAEVITDQSDEVIRQIVSENKYRQLVVSPVSLEEAFLEIVSRDEQRDC